MGMLRNIIILSLVSLAFLCLFIPYMVFKSVEMRINGIPTEGQIVCRLGDMALQHLYGDENE